MSFATHRTISALKTTLFLTTRLSGVPKQIVRNAKTASTPGIAGLGGKLSKGAATGLSTKGNSFALPVEEDVEKLTTHLCGSNLLKEGGEDVKLKPDSEYPDWLWTIRLERPPHYSKLTPDDMEYWRQLKKIHKQEKKRIKARQRF